MTSTYPAAMSGWMNSSAVYSSSNAGNITLSPQTITFANPWVGEPPLDNMEGESVISTPTGCEKFVWINGSRRGEVEIVDRSGLPYGAACGFMLVPWVGKVYVLADLNAKTDWNVWNEEYELLIALLEALFD